MNTINYRNLSLSELSFLIINKTEGTIKQNKAYDEIQRRFSNNACNYKAFMEYEEEAISKRGCKISDYLIDSNINIQKLMEIYFDYVCCRPIYTHGNLLFSEVMLCNENSKGDFFSKVIRKELERIKQKINLGNISKEEIETLKFISNFLNDRVNKEIPLWQENDRVLAVEDISDTSFFISEKEIEIVENRYKKLDEKGHQRLAKIYLLAFGIKQIMLDSDILNFMAMDMFAKKDIARLSKQKRSINKSMQKDYDIDYSFVDKPKILELSKKFNGI